MQRQREQQAIRRRPSPCFDERRDLRADVLVCRDRALWPPRGAAGVDDHRAAVRSEMRKVFPHRRGERRRCRQKSRTRGLRDRHQHRRRRRVADDHGCTGVADHVVELGRGMRDRQRNRDTAGSPDAALHRRIREAWRHEERDARLVQVGVVAEQCASNAPRCLIQLVVGIRPVGSNDGDAGFTHRVDVLLLLVCR